jgi:hypothetical protein
MQVAGVVKEGSNITFLESLLNYLIKQLAKTAIFIGTY